MIVLLDTHTLLWWWSRPDLLARRAAALIRDRSTTVMVSAASAWEIATKTRIGKLPSGERILAAWNERVATDRFRELAVSWAHTIRAGSLQSSHRDPFDRMLAAQGLIEGVPVVSADAAIGELGAERVWE